MDLEKKRGILEELERIEEALTARIKKSDEYLPTSITSREPTGKRLYSDRVNALRRWETASLVNKYNTIASKWAPALKSEPLDFDTELAKLDSLDDEVPAFNLKAYYSLHSSKLGRQRFVSDYTNTVIATIDSEYPVKENFGRTLDLESFYNKLVDDSVLPHSTSYRDYLVSFETYGKLGGERLLHYLREFYDRANSLGEMTGTTVDEILSKQTPESESESSEEASLYCEVCERSFANANVYNAHLKGKKHKRALDSKPEPKKPSLRSTLSISQFDELLVLIRPALKATIADIDRRAGMSFQDRNLEVEAIERERELEDNFHSDDEKYDHVVEAKTSGPDKILKGPEGTPIPRWLYRLQGLGMVFHCEICGPQVKYSGRKAYERHFNDSIHLQGLKKLGIVPSSVYNGISTIEEAKDLQKKLKLKPAALHIEKEVEDSEGNALDERTYEDLKRQGLI